MLSKLCGKCVSSVVLTLRLSDSVLNDRAAVAGGRRMIVAFGSIRLIEILV